VLFHQQGRKVIEKTMELCGKIACVAILMW